MSAGISREVGRRQGGVVCRCVPGSLADDRGVVASQDIGSAAAEHCVGPVRIAEVGAGAGEWQSARRGQRARCRR